MGLFILLPAYNEQESIAPLFKRFQLLQSLCNMDIKLIFVDDGSTDATAKTALDESQSLGISLKLVQHVKNAGLGQAIKTGFTTFLEVSEEGDFLAAMDCDNTQPPELLMKMYDIMVGGTYDIAIASRYQKGAKVIGLSPLRVLTSYGASWLFRIAAPISGVRDYTCGYRMYNRYFLVSLFEYYGNNLFTEKGFACMVDLLLKAKVLKPKVAEVPMVLRYDQKPTASKMKVLKTIAQTLRLLSKNLLLTWKTYNLRSVRPLR
ncbi:glycosyltransferase family 2 protein [aff. Roholtiella sp. LEGE 12411]|uniref:glycosyltransferase family 2 protein n=1 Tax=aff. Roholtiella sp. LEGE 12411 TaxID=1828822 RepID=UPI001882C0F9|nr:glycosyltransferase family 2 protein [aff. Roholtiella sp. LEGE 12411]MBE9037698.1 glycosyltransferase family 2 protein [aff. Roholtiella sp. LEGE 12411]